MGWVASNESSGKEERHEIGVISSPGKSFMIKVIFLELPLLWFYCYDRLYAEKGCSLRSFNDKETCIIIDFCYDTG